MKSLLVYTGLFFAIFGYPLQATAQELVMETGKPVSCEEVSASPTSASDELPAPAELAVKVDEQDGKADSAGQQNPSPDQPAPEKVDNDSSEDAGNDTQILPSEDEAEQGNQTYKGGVNEDNSEGSQKQKEDLPKENTRGDNGLLGEEASELLDKGLLFANSGKSDADLQPVTLEEGSYYIESSSGFSLDIENNSVDSTANVQGGNKDYTAAQRFIFQTAGIDDIGTYYIIKNVNSGKVLDCAYGGTTSGTNVWQVDANNTAAQYWYLYKSLLASDSILFRIVNIASGLALDMDLYSANKNVSLDEVKDSNSQLWNIEKCESTLDDGAYEIVTALPEHSSVEISWGSGDNGATTQLFTSNNTVSQAFAFNYDKNSGYYTIKSYVSGKCLELPGGSQSIGTQIAQFTPNGTIAQLWQPVQNADGTWTLISALTGYAIDAVWGQGQSGTTLSQQRVTHNLTQRFFVIPSNPLMKTDSSFTIRNAKNQDVSIDVINSSTAANAGLQICYSKDVSAQKFMLTMQDDGTFFIQTLLSGYGLFDDGGRIVVKYYEEDSEKQTWRFVATDNGSFEIQNVKTGNYLGLSNSLNSFELLKGLAGDANQLSLWNAYQVSLIKEGWYHLPLKIDRNLSLNADGWGFYLGDNVSINYTNYSNSQTFYIEESSWGAYRLFNAMTNHYVDIAYGGGNAGLNVLQWNGAWNPSQQWSVVWDGRGGYQFVSAYDSFALGYSSGLAAGTNVLTVGSQWGAQKASFAFVEASGPKELSLAERVSILTDLGGGGYTISRSNASLSASTAAWLYDAVALYGQYGYDVGFVLMDLNTGASLTYNQDTTFYSASTIKGPYIAAVNMYAPWLLSYYEPSMYDTIYTSNNDAYAYVNGSVGMDPLWRLAAETNAYGLSLVGGNYAYLSPRDLAKLWLGMEDYFTSNHANADWCRNVYSTNYAITSRDALDYQYTIYAKSGWLSSAPISHAEGCIVMDGDTPYLMTIMSSASPDNRWLMRNLQGALNAVHGEIIQGTALHHQA